MARRSLARALLCAAVLELGAYTGAKIRLEDIEAIMNLSQPKVVCLQREDAEGPLGEEE